MKIANHHDVVIYQGKSKKETYRILATDEFSYFPIIKQASHYIRDIFTGYNK